MHGAKPNLFATELRIDAQNIQNQFATVQMIDAQNIHPIRYHTVLLPPSKVHLLESYNRNFPNQEKLRRLLIVAKTKGE